MREPMKYINGPMGFFAPSDTYVRWDDYAALAAENERLRKAGEWQPIETSPDGNALILIMHKDKEVEIIYASDLCHYYINIYPTHWMPLPAAPAAKEGRDAK